eukprot:gb/GFBE01028857.1/.p1 GENE.gb/GFBE01028857.1/~~gb/GFBE01028857.1/.p1  ORF type:complete len:277 (+),score=77.75 gb/GFBE01028857.1/:1-831(+)
MFSWLCTAEKEEQVAYEQVVDDAVVHSPSKLGIRTGVDDSMSASKALEVLKQGNARFVTGAASFSRAVDPKLRGYLASHGQRPLAAVIGCADSRCPVEQIFDARPGDIFVLRNAGNTCTHAEGSMVGSVEYSVLHLKTKLVLVLGHTGCGAIMAATKAFMEQAATEQLAARRKATSEDSEGSGDKASTVASDAEADDKLTGFIKSLMPVAADASETVKRGASIEEIAAAAVKVNVGHTMKSLTVLSKVIREAAESGDIEIRGGVYNMQTGSVEFLD